MRLVPIPEEKNPDDIRLPAPGALRFFYNLQASLSWRPELHSDSDCQFNFAVSALDMRKAGWLNGISGRLLRQNSYDFRMRCHIFPRGQYSQCYSMFIGICSCTMY